MKYHKKRKDALPPKQLWTVIPEKFQEKISGATSIKPDEIASIISSTGNSGTSNTSGFYWHWKHLR